MLVGGQSESMSLWIWEGGDRGPVRDGLLAGVRQDQLSDHESDSRKCRSVGKPAQGEVCSWRGVERDKKSRASTCANADLLFMN